MDKRGLSSVIITVILVAFSLIAVGVVWVVMQNVLSEKTDGISLDSISLNLEIKQVQVEDGVMEVKVKRNSGEGDLVGIKFVVSDGVSSNVFERNTTLNELEEDVFYLNYSDSISKISIAPIFSLESDRESVGNILDEYALSDDLCASNCSCASTTCIGVNCSNGCGGYCEGTLRPDDCGILECGYAPNGCGNADVCGVCSFEKECVNGSCVYAFNTTGLISWWRFEGDVEDEVGLNDGSLSGATYNSTGGVNGGAYEFDGTDDYLYIEDSISLDYSNFTISIWAKNKDTSIGWNRLISKKDIWNSANGWEITLVSGSDTQIDLRGSSSTCLRTDCVSNWKDNLWHHVVAVYESNKVYLYCDGDYKISGTIAPIVANELPLVFGTDADFVETDWKGSIDEVMFFNRSLSEEEIDILYNWTSSQS